MVNTLVTNYLHQIYPPIPLRSLLFAKLFDIIYMIIAISNPRSNNWGFFILCKTVDNFIRLGIDIILLMLYTVIIVRKDANNINKLRYAMRALNVKVESVRDLLDWR